MCLRIKNGQQPEIATEDIICYKVLSIKKSNRGNIIYRTYYKDAAVVLGKSYKSDFDYNLNGDIEEGLHSMVSVESIDDLFRVGHFYNFTRKVIVACIIPKGALYYLGSFNNLLNSYASNELKYTKEIVKELNNY